MDDFFHYDPQTVGSKGLVLIGDKVLVYRRDENTEIFPLQLDLPGGGPEGNETPFETFKREVKEEFALDIEQNDVIYLRKYPSSIDAARTAYFPVVQLAEEQAANIQFGSEGVEYLLLSADDYLARSDAWPIFQERTRDFVESLPK